VLDVVGEGLIGLGWDGRAAQLQPHRDAILGLPLDQLLE